MTPESHRSLVIDFFVSERKGVKRVMADFLPETKTLIEKPRF